MADDTNTRNHLFMSRLSRKPIGEQVFDRLKQAIVSGHLTQGNRLVETQIAKMMHISRTPVREAIHKLEREGLVEKLPKGGFQVKAVSREDIDETFGIRGVLESYAARLAAEKWQGSDLDGMEEKIRQFQKCLDRGDMDALPGINTEFHDILYDLSQSRRLVKMINDLRDQIFRFRHMILKDKVLAEASNEDHRQMLERIRRRDGDGVERLVREHIRRGKEAVLKTFDDTSDKNDAPSGRVL